jgi:hypothetical protein
MTSVTLSFSWVMANQDSKTYVMRISVLLTLIALAALGCGTTGHQTNNGPPRSAGPQLRLLSKSSIVKFGYVTVEGEVQNISGERIWDVQAVATHYGGDGQFIKSEVALIENDPLLPDQISPYKVMTLHDQAMTTFTVAFKRSTGGGLYFIDGTPREPAPRKKEQE